MWGAAPTGSAEKRCLTKSTLKRLQKATSVKSGFTYRNGFLGLGAHASAFKKRGSAAAFVLVQTTCTVVQCLRH